MHTRHMLVLIPIFHVHQVEDGTLWVGPVRMGLPKEMPGLVYTVLSQLATLAPWLALRLVSSKQAICLL